MSKLSKSFKGQISKETEKAIEITVIEKDEIFSTWIPKSALNMKEMPVDCLSVIGVQVFHIHQWFVDLKAKEKPSDENTKTEFLEKAETYETRTLSAEPVKPTELATQKPIIIQMPPPVTNPEFPFFPNMSVLELRAEHAGSNNPARRGHIENIILEKRAMDVAIDRLAKSQDILTAILELTALIKEALKK